LADDSRPITGLGQVAVAAAFVVLIVAATSLVTLVLLIQGAQQRDRILDTNRLLVECTTPGPNTPTPGNPATGNDCYDRGQARVAEAIRQIVDFDSSGCPDLAELRHELFPSVPLPSFCPEKQP